MIKLWQWTDGSIMESMHCLMPLGPLVGAEAATDALSAHAPHLPTCSSPPSLPYPKHVVNAGRMLQPLVQVLLQQRHSLCKFKVGLS